MSRKLITAFAVGLAFAGLSAGTLSASAAPKAKRAPVAKVVPEVSPRAYAVDPAGNYAGLPDWARQAFGPRAGGR